MGFWFIDGLVIHVVYDRINLDVPDANILVMDKTEGLQIEKLNEHEFKR